MLCEPFVQWHPINAQRYRNSNFLKEYVSNFVGNSGWCCWEDCCNPYTNAHVDQTGDEEDIEAEKLVVGSDQDSDDAMDDLATVDDLYKW